MNFNLINTEKEVILFHGTTKSAFVQISNYGFNSNSDIWNCSNPHMTYFYEFEKFCESECLEVTDEYAYNLALSRANEQGQIQNAFKEIPDPETVVLEIHIPKEWADEYLEPDMSARNMDSCGAVQMLTKDLNSLISRRDVTIYVHRYDFAVKCSLLYLTGLFDNEYAQPGFERLTRAEYTALQTLAKSGFFNDDFYDICVSNPNKIESFRWI